MLTAIITFHHYSCSDFSWGNRSIHITAEELFKTQSMRRLAIFSIYSKFIRSVRGGSYGGKSRLIVEFATGPLPDSGLGQADNSNINSKFDQYLR